MLHEHSAIKANPSRGGGAKLRGLYEAKRLPGRRKEHIMESPELSSLTALEILATSLVMRLTLDELEWLLGNLAQHTQEKRRKEALEPLATLLAG